MSTSSSHERQAKSTEGPKIKNFDGKELNIALEPIVEAKVYNLTVLVRVPEKGVVTARAANIALPEVAAPTIRQALSRIVNSAKSTITRQLDKQQEISWITPPNEPTELESRYVVPLHL